MFNLFVLVKLIGFVSKVELMATCYVFTKQFNFFILI